MPGKEYAEEIIDGITGADILLLLLSKESNVSQHVFREVERAVSSHVPIVVYKMEEVALTKSLAYFLMVNQWIDGTKDNDLNRILEVVNSQETGAGKCDEKRMDGRKFQRGKKAADSRRKGRTLFWALPAVCLVLGLAVFILVRGFHNPEGRGGGETDTFTESRISDIALGAAVELGTYGGEPIEWRLLHFSEDKTQAILVADKILTMKCFDAAESGTYNFYDGQDYWTTAPEPDAAAFAQGSNLWVDSNIRAWLNSEKNVVLYEDQAPDTDAMSEKKNGYSTEPGFLTGFSREERAVLREYSLFTVENILMDSMGTTTQDRVFLLSEEELPWFAEADIHIYTGPTETAVQQDQTKWYEAYSLSLGVEEYIWFLRDPADGSASACKAVTNGYTGELLTTENAGVEGFGIRPAVCVDYETLLELVNSRDR